MTDTERVPQLLLEAATTVAHSCNARAILVAVGGLPPIEAVPPKTILLTRDDNDAATAARLGDARGVIRMPDVELGRMGQVELAIIMALSNQLISLDDAVVFLTGPFRGRIDSLVVMTIGVEYELFEANDEQKIDDDIKRAVFHRVLTLALQLGLHGREGKKVGSLLVVGDHVRVLEQAEQMILNPFKGYDETERNLLDDRMTETVKEYSSLDGAFIIRDNGVVDTAGARLKAGLSEGLPSGLGSRHAAAAGITSTTRAIAVTVSQSDGTVRVWRGGNLVATFEPNQR